MTWSIDLNVPYHQQDTDIYCGAATAQMILDSMGIGLIDQTTLFNSNHNHQLQAWTGTDAQGLCYTLNNLKPPAHLPFVVYAESSEALGSHKIVFTLWHYGVGTGTLVYGCGHWVVVRGASTDVDPSTLGESTPYNIYGFWINNPWPPCPSWYNPSLAPPPPHSNTDGCGSGASLGGHSRGVANEYVAYQDWKDTYFTGCTWPGSTPQFISVCDPEVPKLGRLVVRRDKGLAEGERIIPAKNVAKFVLHGMERHKLLQDETFAMALEGAEPATPILVQRLDRADSFYYLAPMVKGEHITATLSIDGLYGDFLGARVHSEPLKKLVVAREEVLDRVLSGPIALANCDRGIVKIHKEASCFYPIMVWKPCRESRSPYYPFHMITAGGTTLYISYDGTIYSELHELGRGG